MDKTIYIVRHAESRYNDSKKKWSIKGLVGERDHGLSAAGVEQCFELRETLVKAAESGDADAEAIMSRDVTYSSPLSRALLTAHLALPRTSQEPHTMVALPEAREHCLVPLLARDSEGTPRDAIEANVNAEIAKVAASASDSTRAVAETPFNVDLSRIHEPQWWIVGEKSSVVKARLAALLRQLYERATSEKECVVLVAHSLMIRTLLLEYGDEDLIMASSQRADSSTTKEGVDVSGNDATPASPSTPESPSSGYISNCSVLRLTLRATAQSERTDGPSSCGGGQGAVGDSAADSTPTDGISAAMDATAFSDTPPRNQKFATPKIVSAGLLFGARLLGKKGSK